MVVQGLKNLASVAYPNRMHALYAMNVNSAIRRAYGMVKRFLTERFQQKIQMKSGAAELTEVLDAAAVPRHLGGTVDHAAVLNGPDGQFSWQRVRGRWVISC